MRRRPAMRDTDPALRDPIAPAPTSDWRDEVKGASGLNMLAGIWLIIAPWVLVYNAADPKWNDVVFGIIVGFFGLTRVLGAYGASWLSWLNALIGVWLFIAAFTIDSSNVAGVNDIVLGIVVFALGVWSASVSDAAKAARRRGRTERRYRGGRPITH